MRGILRLRPKYFSLAKLVVPCGTGMSHGTGIHQTLLEIELPSLRALLAIREIIITIDKRCLRPVLRNLVPRIETVVLYLLFRYGVSDLSFLEHALLVI